MKKILLSITLTLSISLMILPTISVYAGDINAVEQDVINYCSGIFYHEGKAYQATPAAISRAYAELAADDMDLTPEKGEAAKRLMTNNIQRGIDEGYLVEVDMPQESTGEITTENSSETDVTSEDTTEENTSKTDETVEDVTTGSMEETTTEAITSTEKENVTTNSQGGDTSGDSEPEDATENVTTVSQTDEVENKVTGNGEVIDIDNMLQSSNDEIIVNQNTEQETLYNVQDYINGQELIVKEEGEIIYQNDLPVKNTGYNLVKGKFVLIAIIFLFSVNALGVFLLSRKPEKR